MWLRSCCRCCFCCGCGPADCGEDDKPTSLDDSSSLIGQQEEAREHAFYVPRRHSSFVPGTCYNSTLVRSEQRPQSECSSSSEEEGGGAQPRRGRCWSTVPALDSTLAAHRQKIGQQTAATSRNRVNGIDPPSNYAGPLAFDKHVLSEIAEVEQGSGEETPPAGSYHAQRADAEIYGYLTFTTFYEKEAQRLTVHLNRATGLPRKGEEPYGTFVRTSLVTCPPATDGGNGHHSRLSRTVKKCLDPVYGEEHLFHTHRSKWKSGSRSSVHYLRLSVIDSERQGRHDAVGHALLPLEEIDGQRREHRLPLTPVSLPVHNLGQVLIGLQYVPTQSRLAVHVIKARHLRLDPEYHKRHLRPLNAKEPLDSFCKVTLTCGGQKVKTCRSRAVAGTDPFYDFKCGFVVPPQYLRDTGTLVSLVARSTLGRRGATLGRAAVLGPYVETADGSATQWGRMILEGRSVVQWRSIYL